MKFSIKHMLLPKIILNAIFITRSVILFFFNLQRVLLLRLGLFSIVYLIFFEEKNFQ
jgi:hypothetical protein